MRKTAFVVFFGEETVNAVFGEEVMREDGSMREEGAKACSK